MNRQWFFRSLIAAALVCGAVSTATAGSTPLDARRIVAGLSRPVFCTAPPGDTDRLFIVQQTGTIRIFDLASATMVPGNFLNVSSLTTGGTFGGDEAGLLGLAFDPDYDLNGFFYIYYYGSGATRVRRYTVSADPNVADASSGLQIIQISQPQSNHNGGNIEFSPIDGYLYIGTGDGGNFNDQGSGHVAGGNSQSINTLLGKMLRIDVSNSAPGNLYDIPADNPFVGVAGLDEIWSYGLRNPYRWCFDRDTGDMWIADVGQDAVEEVNFEPPGVAGRNYGWRCMEGNSCTGLSGCTCFSAALTGPVRTYTHGTGCSITGGRIYRGSAMPDMQGTYYYADYCANRIWSGEINGTQTGLNNFQQRLPGELTPPAGNGSIGSISGFGEDGYGEVYVCDLNGEVFKIVPADIDNFDCNGNLIIDSIEGLGAGTDCNSNGIDDDCEVATGQAADCDGNGIPDECDIAAGTLEDCNENGIADSCEVLTMNDCNGNGIPDSCDVDSGVLADCNGNGLADLCEVLDGTVDDCNANQIPDSCDLAAGVLQDSNGDGFADSCDFYVIQALAGSGVTGGSAVHTTAGTFPETMLGYSIALEFDAALLAVSEVSVDNTAGATADFVAPNFDNVEGWATIGVIMDFSPPVDNVIDPGLGIPLMDTIFDVDGSATAQTTTICPVALQGNPAVQTVYSNVAGTSLEPNLVCGDFEILEGTPFVRGDANDDGGYDIADQVYILAFLFSSGPGLNCDDAGDINDDGALDIADPVNGLNGLFSGGAPPVTPHPNCGIDPTDDTVTCDAFNNCP